jgi:hypothetical protein
VRRCSLAFVLTCLACTGARPADETGGSETGSSETGEAGPLLLGDPTIVHHPKQPMILDVIVELDAPGTGELVHTEDPGVAVFQLEPAAGEPATSLRFRVRGLAPATSHPLELTVHEAGGERSESWTGNVTTDEALRGFVPSFEVSTPDPNLVSDDLRLFDAAWLFTAEPAGLVLVDKAGTTRWYFGDTDGNTTLDDAWNGIHLRADGSISYTRRNSAFVIDELGELQMEISAEQIGAYAGFHHDLIELPNGNFVVLGYSFADVEYEGEGVLHVAGDMLFEFTSAGELVWTWDSFDYLDPQRRRDGFFIPQKIADPLTGEGGYDWTHANGLIYRAQDDTIVVSMRHQDWLIAIDHQSGEILWRLGDEGDFTLIGDEYWFFHQHSPQWQPDGSLLVYDNAVGNPERPDSEAHSRAARYVLDYDAMTATLAWADDDPTFISALGGDADRSSEGHVLRLDSALPDLELGAFVSRLHELDPKRTPNFVWSLRLPVGLLSYRATPTSRWVGEPAL